MLIDLYYFFKSRSDEKKLLNYLLKKYNYPTGDKKKDQEIYDSCKKRAKEFLLNCRDF